MFCQFVLLIVFLSSTIGKLISPRNFYEAIEDFELISTKLTKMSARCIILLEIGVVATSFLYPPLAGVLSALLLSTFTFIIVRALNLKKTVSCNCFGSSIKKLSVFDLVRNILFIVCSVFILFSTIHGLYPYPFNQPLLYQIQVLLISGLYVSVVLNLDEIYYFLRSRPSPRG
jgi:hypothetical protein